MLGGGGVPFWLRARQESLWVVFHQDAKMFLPNQDRRGRVDWRCTRPRALGWIKHKRWGACSSPPGLCTIYTTWLKNQQRVARDVLLLLWSRGFFFFECAKKEGCLQRQWRAWKDQLTTFKQTILKSFCKEWSPQSQSKAEEPKQIISVNAVKPRSRREK